MKLLICNTKYNIFQNRYFRSLEKINLSGNGNIPESILHDLFKELAILPSLKELDVSVRTINTGEKAKALVDALQ